MTLLHTLAAVWLAGVALAGVALAGVGILAWIGWRMAVPPKRPAIATACPVKCLRLGTGRALSRLHVAAQDRIDTGLITAPLGLEERQHIPVNANRDDLL